MSYNALGLPVSLTDRIGRWHYDPRGNLLRLENSNCGEYRSSYDPAGRLLSETRPDDTARLMEWGRAVFLVATGEWLAGSRRRKA